MADFSISKLSPIELSSHAIWVLGKISIFLAVAVAITARQELDEYRSISPPAIKISKQDSISVDTIDSELSAKLATIRNRDLFGVAKSDDKKEEPKQDTKKTSLDFRLVGTSVTNGRDPFAIIENSSKKQDVFEISNLVFDKATIKEIHPDKVILERDGQLETLELEGDKNPTSGGTGIQSSGADFTVPEEEITEALNNLPVLLSQARAVPYFRNGESVGMRLYAIKSGSLYEKLGLKNSDIIKNINNTAVTDPAKALKLFEDLKSERSIGVQVEREGQDLQLNYQVR